MVEFNIFLEDKKSFISDFLCYPSFPYVCLYLYIYIHLSTYTHLTCYSYFFFFLHPNAVLLLIKCRHRPCWTTTGLPLGWLLKSGCRIYVCLGQAMVKMCPEYKHELMRNHHAWVWLWHGPRAFIDLPAGIYFRWRYFNLTQQLMMVLKRLLPFPSIILFTPS